MNPDQYAYMYQKQHEAKLQKDKDLFEARFQKEQTKKHRVLGPAQKGDISYSHYQSQMHRLEEDELTEEDKQKYRVRRLKDKYLVSDSAIVEVDEDKLTTKERE